MDLALNEEQRILQKSAADFLKKECPKELVRSLDESEDGHSPELWKKMADLGWLGLLLPEEYGGIGWSFVHQAVLLEEMGFNICPGPFISTTVLGSLPVLWAGSEEQKQEILPKAATGDLILTMALTESDGGSTPAAVQMKAEEKDGGFVLDGVKLFVPDAGVADYILCAARTGEGSDSGEGLSLFLVKKDAPGVTVTPLKAISRDKYCEVAFDNVQLDSSALIGEIGQAWPVIKDVVSAAALARSALTVGSMRAALDLSASYSKERVQFGKPIGSYQAIQHYLADMWVDLLGTRNLVMKAAWTLSAGLPAHKEIAMAKIRSGELGRKTTTVGHRIFGAIGFTMEHDLHLYHRRTVADDLAFGGPDFHYEQAAEGLGL